MLDQRIESLRFGRRSVTARIVHEPLDLRAIGGGAAAPDKAPLVAFDRDAVELDRTIESGEA